MRWGVVRGRDAVVPGRCKLEVILPSSGFTAYQAGSAQGSLLPNASISAMSGFTISWYVFVYEKRSRINTGLEVYANSEICFALDDISSSISQHQQHEISQPR